MSDYERYQTPIHEQDHVGAMIRTILQGLILTGIIAVVGMLWRQNEATAAQNVSLAQLQVQVSVLQQSLSGMPELNNRMMRFETTQAELIRRQNNDEVRWQQLDNLGIKGRYK